ncbi:hypothetical protein Tco_0684934 [Tanacetum coccineum]
MATSMEARIAEFASTPTPSSLPPSLLSPWSSPLPQIPSPPLPVSSPPLPLPSPPTSPTYAQAPLGYKADGIRLRVASPPTHQPSEIQSPLLLLPSIAHRDGIPKAEMPPQKRACLTTPAFGFEVGESSADDGDFLRARVNTLFRDRPYHRHTVMLLDREATYAHRAWASYEDRSAAIEAHTLEARDPEPQDEPAKADRSC